MVLPVKDSVGGSIGFTVFKEVENYLKESSWCYYKSNSEILNLLSNYKRNLDDVLENKEVLKIISEKTKSGSMIKIKVINEVNGVLVGVTVLGENGEDVYFKEETKLNSNDPILISRTIKNWLDVYEKTIPYDGIVVGILGSQFSIDIGKNRGLYPNTEIVVVRPMGKKKHPLLKEIVDWELERIASAKVVFSSIEQAQAKILKYDTKKRMKTGDWIVIKKEKKAIIQEGQILDDKKGFEFGKLGTVTFLANYGSGSSSSTDTSTKKISGSVLGLDVRMNLWVTRKYWAGLEFGKKSGTLEKEEGTLDNDTNSFSADKVALIVGYKYLPMGFFYGPQVDGYLGYSSYGYSLDTQTSDGFVEASFKGITLGVSGSMPIQRVFRIFLDFRFVFNPTYSEETELYGEDDSASTHSIEIGAKYQYAPSMTFDLSYGFDSSKAKFLSPVRSYGFKVSTLRLGSTLTF
jgi:hypothetical protein